MGGALLGGWLAQGLPRERVVVIEPASAADALKKKHGVAVYSGPEGIDATFRPKVVVFAVKPQAMAEVAPAYARYVELGPVFLSIAAGKTIASFRQALGQRATVVRAMPNTPAAIGRGISVCCAGPGVSETQRRQCTELLEAVGEVAWVEQEDLLDPVTAVSGSGPAYVFLLVEALAEAGFKAGLPPELAGRLARATVVGSGELLRQSPDTPKVLRENVTSPGGTTAEALKILMGRDGLQPLLDKAIAAATRRARELAK